MQEGARGKKWTSDPPTHLYIVPTTSTAEVRRRQEEAELRPYLLAMDAVALLAGLAVTFVLAAWTGRGLGWW